MLFMVKDPMLWELAICQFVMSNGLFDMLLETDNMRVLNFSVQKEVSIRQFVKTEKYVRIVRKMAELMELKDEQLAICLLDKIKQHQAVLEKLVGIQFRRISSYKPLDFCQPGVQISHHSGERPTLARVCEEFQKMLNDYKKEGL